MTTLEATPRTVANVYTAGKLPKWTPWALLGASVVVMFALFLVISVASGDGLNIAGWLITAISREIFAQTPRLHQEAALALGATRWEMIRMAVLPFGRSGIVSAAMLGLGRALGETMAVAMVLSVSGAVTFQLFTPNNPNTIAANIALSFPEAYGTNINVLIATGLILFVVTFAVNAVARYIVSRRKEFSGAN